MGAPSPRSRLPDLGPRGEGWLAAQLTLLALVVAFAVPHLSSLNPRDATSWVVGVGGAVAMLAGGSLVVSGFLAHGSRFTAMPRPRADADLLESGVYRRIRHPMYAGLILGSFGVSGLTRSLPSVAVAVILAIVLDAKARREEAWLAERYTSYAAYRARTKRFLPPIY